MLPDSYNNYYNGCTKQRNLFLLPSIVALVLVASSLIFVPGCEKGERVKGLIRNSYHQLPSHPTKGQEGGAAVEQKLSRLLVALVGGDILPFRIHPHETCQFLEYSPDGRYLAYIEDGDIWLYDQQTKRSRNLTQTPRARESRPVWSPDGRRIAFLTNTNSDNDSCGVGVPTVVNIDSTNRQQLMDEPRLIWPLTWSPDGKRIAYALPKEISETGVAVLELNTANKVSGPSSLLRPGEFGMEWVFFISASWSPCRQEEIAVFFTECRDEPTREEILSGRPRNIRQGYAILDVAQKKARAVYEFRAPFLYGKPAIWDPSGDYLILRFEPTPTVHPFETRIIDRHGREILTLPGFAGTVWSPDGKQFAYIDDSESRKVHLATFPPPGGKKTVVKTIYYDDSVEQIAW